VFGRRILSSLVVSIAALPAVLGGCEPTDRLPDLRVGELYGFSVQRTSSGRALLRFGTIGFNVGAGPLEARGVRTDTDSGSMLVTQRIYDSEGGHRDRRTSAVMVYDTGDNHDHWHTRQFMTVTMYRLGNPTGNVYGLRKLGYCLLDAERMSNPPPNSPETRQYPNGSCGNRSSTSVRTGLSIGYGDDYPPQYAHQWMDVNRLPVGTYRICATVDPFGDFVESRDDNNQRWVDVRVNVRAGTVQVLDTAVGRCGPNVS